MYRRTMSHSDREAFHVLSDGAQYKGNVVMARLTDSNERVPVKRVYDDIRGTDNEQANP
jgi:hypothetical protein